MIQPADLEWVVADYLDAGLDVPVSNALAGDGPQVVVFSTGGATRTVVSSEVRLVFDAYALQPGAAHALAARVYALVRDLDCRRVGGVQFYDVDPGPPYSFPHPDKPDLYRYQFSALIHARHVEGAD
mgnify:CR=1 FL=1